MEYKRKINSTHLIIGVITILMIFSALLFNRIKGHTFNIRGYGNSAGEIRATLLKEVPLGSSLDDVYKFMKKNNIANTTNSNDTCGYTELRENRVSFRACAGIFSGLWLIHFSFDETKHLVDITTIGYYP